ncbi:MAG: trypsin-like peptidase domain-containing protein [Rhodobacteraceae bacterium]|nr:trypsin-like peptidase domain-containing protein [Paracoccaceae bacterium]
MNRAISSVTHTMINSFYRPLRAVGLAVVLALAGPALAHDEDIAPLVDQLKKSVVNIELYGSVSPNNSLGDLIPQDSPLWELLNPQMPGREGQDGQPREQRIKIGSGFITSDDGYIVTNHHVIEGGGRIIVEFENGDRLPAEIVGTDKTTDIAVLKVESDVALPAVPFGDSEAAREGDTVIAIGNPFGLGFSVSKGIISARYRRMGGIYDEFIQTDAAINRGNSGGPLFNLEGEVIGVNTAIIPGNSWGGSGGGSIGIAFSMSSAVVETVVDSLIETGSVKRGWLGIVMQDVSEDFAEALDLDAAEGVLVTAVSEGSPAEKAGLRRGDVILSVDGEAITSLKHMQRLIVSAGPGAEVAFAVHREGEIISKTATLALRDDSGNVAMVDEPVAPGESGSLVGMDIAEINEDLRQQYRLGDDVEGLVVTGVEAGSEAYTKLIRPGDVILEINNRIVDTVSSARGAIEDARTDGKSRVLLLMQTRGTTVAVTLGL